MRNNVLNCIAIDDDPSCLKLIRDYCSKIPSVNLTATFTNPQDAVQVLNNNQTDLIFLDVVMPQITGPEFLKTLYNPPMVIFISAFREYASEGFDADAADYIVKPFAFDRFSKAINKAYQLIRLKTISGAQSENQGTLANEFIMVKVEYSTIRVDLDEILYVEGLKDYVKIYTEGKLILTKTTMKNIMEKLPPSSFSRVHKSYIISVDKIEMIENSRIVIGNQRIPIGESYRSSFFDMINRNLV